MLSIIMLPKFIYQLKISKPFFKGEYLLVLLVVIIFVCLNYAESCALNY